MMKKIAILLVCGLVALAACKEKKAKEIPQETPITSAPSTPPEPLVDTAALRDAEENKNAQRVIITTDLGQIVIKLHDETPKHRDNFIKLVKSGFYKDLLFHRVVKEFMIQGGDPDSKNPSPDKMLGGGDIGYTIPAELTPKRFHKRGALAAAQKSNPEKNSSGCQFYIVQGKTWPLYDLQNMAQQNNMTFTDEQLSAYTTLGGAPFLDNTYTVFGQVISGMEVVDKIANAEQKNETPLKYVKFSIELVTK